MQYTKVYNQYSIQTSSLSNINFNFKYQILFLVRELQQAKTLDSLGNIIANLALQTNTIQGYLKNLIKKNRGKTKFN